MERTLADWIADNIDEVRRLTRQGVLNSRLINQYNIYLSYLSKSGGKMDKYYHIADEMKLGVNTVIRAVKSMERNI